MKIEVKRITIVEVDEIDIANAMLDEDCPSSIGLEEFDDCSLSCDECWANVLRAIKS